MHYTIKDKILYRVGLFYASKEKALKWYETPHNFFKDRWGKIITPEKMVELGKGNEVLKWIETCLD
jgi:hypothetical protein